MQRNSKPLTWRPRGLSDSLDASQAGTGSMSILQDLIPDPSTTGLYQCRPAAIQLGNINGQGPFSSGFSTGFQFAPTQPQDLGIISVFKVVGDFVYGMAASSITVPGNDLPFAFNLLTNTKVPVTGTITATTTPASQPFTGSWIPPQMDVVGSKALLAHPGFSGAGGFWAGYFDISIPNAPVWHATNMGGAITFAFAPSGVAQFFNRAYWIYNLPTAPAVIFSDVLNPFNATNANQILTFGDNVVLTAIAGLPLSNQLGGIIQSLMVFKNVTNIYQITGDAALTSNPLSVNTLNVATGTLAPNSLAPTPLGLAFISPEGLRIIDFNANVSNPMGEDGSGIAIPFQYAFIPSRISAAANGSIYRVTVQNTRQQNNPVQEYWYDFIRKTWSGPHGCTQTHARPYKNTFIITPTFLVGTLWQSDYFQTQNSSFVENGNAMTWRAQTTLLPDIDEMVNVCITEATLDLCFPIGMGNITVLALDQVASVIHTVTLTSQGGSVPPSNTPTPYNTIWGAFTWGNALWGSGTTGGGGASGTILPPLAPYILPWTGPIVWSRGSINMSGASAQGFDLGALHLRYQVLRQLMNTAAAA